MDALISVIIPVYNVEQWLDRCVQSVFSQTYHALEIILVDDGSPDKCPQMCDEYKAIDTRVQVIHKENGGLASARNAGLKVATGEYVFFLDSDDWIDSNAISELFDVAEQYQVDFVRFRPMYAGWPNHEDGDLCDFGTENGLKEGLYERKQIESEIFPRLIATPQLTMGVIVSAWRSLYNRRFIETNKLWFDDEVRYSEDAIFSAKLVYRARSFYYLDGPRYYHYFYNPQSITKSFKKDRWESCKKLICCFDNTFSKITDFDFSNQLILEKIYCVMVALSQRRLIDDLKERKCYCSEICDDSVTIAAFKHLGLVDVPVKLRILLLLVKYKQAWLLARI